MAINKTFVFYIRMFIYYILYTYLYICYILYVYVIFIITRIRIIYIYINNYIH